MSPVGQQVARRWYADATVPQAAACFEAVQPRAQHCPPLD
jgi:hypothetical protein